MKDLEVSNMGNSQPYPMYFTIKGKDNPSDSQIVTGNGLLTIVHTKPIEIGDTIKVNGVVHKVEVITETRTPKGRHPKEAIFYSVNTTYQRVVTPR